jgi:hypothetical protein
MSQFYDLASLVVIPSGYKASTIYAQKPLTTDGQLSFTRASTATRVNASGLIETVASNVPRLDYTNSSCPKILLEPQRSNLNEAATDFSSVVYFTNQATRTTGQADPAAGTGATRFLETTATDNHGFFYTFYNPPATGAVTQSIFVKDNGRGAVKFGASGQSVSFVFTFATGAISNVIGGPSATSATQYANGYWRLSMTFLVAAGSPINHTFVYGWNGTATSYAGDITKGFLVYGAQFEYGEYPTSLILTTGASVTRVADVCNKTSVSALIGQTEGTIYAELNFPNATSGASSYFYVTDGTFNNAVIIGREPSGGLPRYMFYINASGSNVLFNATVTVQSGFAKLALAYKSGSWAAYLNGTLVVSGTNSLTFATMSRIGIGTNDGAITVTGDSMIAKEALIFKTRLTNAQLAELTTL